MNIHGSLKVLVLTALVGTLVSCGGDEDSLGVSNVSPTGSVGGLVVDAATMKEMQAVNINVIAGGKIYPDNSSAQTNASGYFSVDKLPSGNLIVQVKPKATEYAAVNITVNLPNSAGEFPLANSTVSMGPLGLLPLATATSAFKVQLVTPDGAPAPVGLDVHLRTSLAYIDFAGGNITSRGRLVVSGKTDNSGVITFTGMPDFHKLAGLVGSQGISDQVRIIIPPYDADKDGALDFLGKEVVFSVLKLKGSIPTVVLNTTGKPSTLKIDASTIAALAGQVGNRIASTTIYATFNMPVLKSLTQISLFDEKGKPVTGLPKFDVTGTVMTITLPSINDNSEYNINIHTYADVEGTMYEGTFGAPFFTPVKSSAVTATLSRAATGSSKINVIFSEPIGTGVANKSLISGDAIIYFDMDIDASGVKGDHVNEVNGTTSDVGLYIDEKNPPGKAGLSGFSRYWTFTLPTDPMSNPLPAATQLKMLFSKASVVMKRADGRAVQDFNDKLFVPN